MDEACAATIGGMAAMIGAAENDVRRLAADEDVDIANINSPGQIVVSGELAKVEAAVGVAKEYGVRRATLLNVAGAYHSRLMQSAYEKSGIHARAHTGSDPALRCREQRHRRGSEYSG